MHRILSPLSRLLLLIECVRICLSIRFIVVVSVVYPTVATDSVTPSVVPITGGEKVVRHHSLRGVVSWMCGSG